MFEKTQFKYQRLFSDRRLGAERVLLFGEHLGDVHTVAVDADGNIVSVMKGNDDGTLRTLKVDSNARMEAVMKGLFGATFKTLATDTDGNLIAILKGASGNDIAVDASGYLTAVMHGDQGAVAQDTNNKLISVMQGSQGINVAQQATTGELKSVMQGLEGATLRTVAVDGSGNIIGVFKGDFDGALKTIAVDTKGRMQAVLTDPEDLFGNPSYMGAGELAARLGSLRYYDRRGDTVFIDDYSEDSGYSKWYPLQTDGTCYARRSTERSYHGLYSLELYAPAGKTAYIVYRFEPLLNNVIGFESRSAFKALTTSDVFWDVDFYDGTYYSEAWIRYKEGKLYCYEPGGWTEFATGINIMTSATRMLFHTFKMVVDFNNYKYVRCLFQGIEYDLSGYDVHKTANSDTKQFIVMLGIDPAGSSELTQWIDSIIFTRSEPL